MSDFSADEWKSWLRRCGFRTGDVHRLDRRCTGAGLVGDARTLFLEEEAKEAAETYTDIEHVENSRRSVGMDHHLRPPPPPKSCQRKNEETTTVDMSDLCDAVEAMS